MQLETTLEKSEPDGYQKLYRNTDEQLGLVIAEIDQWMENLEASRQAGIIAGEPDAPLGVAVDAGGIRQAFEDLKGYLSGYNPDALESLSRLERLTQGQHRKERNEIRKLVDELEFDQAMDKLKALSGIWS